MLFVHIGYWIGGPPLSCINISSPSSFLLFYYYFHPFRRFGCDLIYWISSLRIANECARVVGRTILLYINLLEEIRERNWDLLRGKWRKFTNYKVSVARSSDSELPTSNELDFLCSSLTFRERCRFFFSFALKESHQRCANGEILMMKYSKCLLKEHDDEMYININQFRNEIDSLCCKEKRL